MISHKGKFIFIPVRRAAGTAINKALRKYCLEQLDEELEESGQVHIFNRGVLSTTKSGETVFGDWFDDVQKYRDYYIIANCRNPWNRLISGYFYSLQGKSYLGRRCSTLEEFLDNLPTKEMSYRWWFHITRTMCEMLMDKDGRYIADFTVRLKIYHRILPRLAKKLA